MMMRIYNQSFADRVLHPAGNIELEHATWSEMEKRISKNMRRRISNYRRCCNSNKSRGAASTRGGAAAISGGAASYINIPNINIVKQSIKSGTIEQVLVKTKGQPAADMMTKKIVAEKWRQQKPRQVRQSSNGSGGGDGSEGDGDGDGRFCSDDAERMYGITILANGSKVVRMRDDVAVATEKQTDEEILVLDSLAKEARMKKSLLVAKRLEKSERIKLCDYG